MGAIFYRAMVQAILMYDLEIWVFFGGNKKDRRRGTHGLPQTDQEQASATDSRWYMVDVQVGSSAGSDRNTVSDDLYREMAGNCGTVIGVMRNIKSVGKGEGL